MTDSARDAYYITTPIYYVNGEPHLGHAYTTMVADAIARFQRQMGREVYFQTGTDEHGLKVQRAAEEQGIAPQALADKNAGLFQRLFDRLGLTHDRFFRTTEEAHHEAVVAILERMKANDDIYLDTYEGWYAAADEAYYDEAEIEDGRAKATGAEVEWVEEKSYFFRLSNYEERLLAWYDQDPSPVQPESRKNEVRSFVAGGLRDLSITRTTFDWGVSFPGDPEHVVYVWVDALTNYITGVGAFGTDEARFERFWPADVHLIGKDILRFHAVYWPAFLMSAGLEPPRQVFAHGWWLIEGQKMSKRAGNFIDPGKLADEVPLDVVRYFLMREVPLGNDGDWRQERLVERNNAELADNLGNLVSRTTKMVGKFTDALVPPYGGNAAAEDQALIETAERTRDEVIRNVEALQTHRALEAIMALSGELNLYVHQNQPWKLAKDPEQRERLEAVLYHALEGLRWLGVLSWAFIPTAAEAILASLSLTGEEVRQLDALSNWGKLQPGTAVTPPESLFPKLEPPPAPEPPEEEAPEKAKAQKGGEQKKGEGAGLIGFDRFMEVEIRVGLVQQAEAVEGADKLLKLTVDVGEERPRTVVAGLAKSFSPEELEGARLAVVCNLKPAKLFGILSEAMILAAQTSDGTLELARYSERVSPGTRIK